MSLHSTGLVLKKKEVTHILQQTGKIEQLACHTGFEILLQEDNMGLRG
jgi:hypothetical protein